MNMETTAVDYFLNECKETKDISLKTENSAYNLYYKGRLFGCINGENLFIINTPSARWQLGTNAIQYNYALHNSVIEADIITISCIIHSILIDMYDELPQPSVNK